MDRMPLVELVYDADCPNIEQARAAIDAALHELGIPGEWKEWNRADDGTPSAIRHYGSPTVLVDRRDVGSLGPDDVADANSCRVYRNECGCLCGAPTARQIVAAITEAAPR